MAETFFFNADLHINQIPSPTDTWRVFWDKDLSKEVLDSTSSHVRKSILEAEAAEVAIPSFIYNRLCNEDEEVAWMVGFNPGKPVRVRVFIEPTGIPSLQLLD